MNKIKEKKKPVINDKLIKSGFARNPKGTLVTTELWEVRRKNAYGQLTLRGYSVMVDGRQYYYGPAFYDKLTDRNSCEKMAERRFDEPFKAYPWPRV